jgi:hypothetical protein
MKSVGCATFLICRGMMVIGEPFALEETVGLRGDTHLRKA